MTNIRFFKAILVGALFAVTSNARAGVQLEFVTKNKGSTFNDVAKDNGLKSYNTTQVERLRLGVSGKANDSLSAFAKFDFREMTLAANSSQLGTGPSSGLLVDNAYLSYLLNPQFTLSMGKLGTLAGGMENQYSGADVYLRSTLSDSTSTFNAGGVGINYTVGDHSFDIQLLNDPNMPDQTQGATRSQTLLQYYGKFMDKKLEAMVFNMASKDKDLPSTASALGLKYDFGFLVLDLDYGTAVAETSLVAKSEITGTVLNVAIPVGDLKFFVKTENSESKNAAGAKDKTYSKLGLAVQKELSKDNAANVHLAYNVLSEKAEATSKTSTENQLVVGFKVFADILAN